MFLVPGNANVHLLDSIGRCEELSFFCPQGENSASMAAEAYSKISGDLGLSSEGFLLPTLVSLSPSSRGCRWIGLELIERVAKRHPLVIVRPPRSQCDVTLGTILMIDFRQGLRRYSGSCLISLCVLLCAAANVGIRMLAK